MEHRRDEHNIYTVELLEAVIPKITGNNDVQVLLRREPALARVTDRLAKRMMQSIFSGQMDREELLCRVQTMLRSSIATGVLLVEALKKEMEVQSLNRSHDLPSFDKDKNSDEGDKPCGSEG